MKKLITIILLFTAVIAVCQKKQDKKTLAVISTEGVKVLFLGFDNPLKIFVEGIPSEKIKVESKNNRIKNLGNGSYTIRLDTSNQWEGIRWGGETTTIDIYAEIKGSFKKIETDTFTIEMLPRAEANIAGKRNEIIFRDELLNSKGLEIKKEKYGLKENFEVKEFSMSADEGEDYITNKIKGNKLSESMKEYITKAPTGQKIYIEDIKAKKIDKEMPKFEYEGGVESFWLIIVDKCK